MPQRTGHLIVDIGKLSGKQEIVRLPEALKIIARKVHGKCFKLCRKLRCRSQYLSRMLQIIDRNLLPILQETLADYDNVKVIHADVLSLDLEKLVQEENGGRPIKVVANLPYYITTPIIMALFEQHVPLANVTVMVQKEVAARMKSGPGSKDYGALSLAVQYYAEPYIEANVPCNCFMPRPNVDSAVIRLTRYEEPPVQVKDEKMLFKIIRASFNQRRKTLQNGLNNSSELNFTKDQIAAAIAEAGFSPSVRGEALTLEQFAMLANCIYEMKK